MDPELLSADEMPAEARQAVADAGAQIAEIRAAADSRIEEIRGRADQAIAQVEAQAEQAVRQRQLALLRVLRPMQDSHARAGRLDEALAIRDEIRGLRASLLQAEPD